MRALVKLSKIFFISVQKLFLFSRKWDFRILDFQISWHHEMPKHEKRNTFYWIIWKINKVCSWNLDSICHSPKQIVSWKNSTKTAAWKLALGPFVFAKN